MPPKRPSATSYSDSHCESGSPSPIKSKKPKTSSAIVTTSPKKTWSASQEKKFLEAIDKLVKSGLWGELKSDDEVAKRGANGVRSHWDAMYKKMKKG